MAFELGLRIVGTASRDLTGGAGIGPDIVPDAEANLFDLVLNEAPDSPWPPFEDPELRDLAAFQRAGWRFRLREELPVLELGIEGDVQTGLLTQHPQRGLIIVEDRLVVGLANDAAVKKLSESYPDMKRLSFGRYVHEIPFDLPEDDLDAAVKSVRKNIQAIVGEEGVRFVDPVLLYNVEPPPLPPAPPVPLDDSSQWQWPKIQLSEALGLAVSHGEGTRVAVIDLGFFKSKELTIDKHVDQHGDAEAPPMEDVWHGTFCAALVGGRRGNNFGNGAAPKCGVILVAVGKPVSSVSLANALKTSISGGADVISCSVAPAGRAWDKLDTLLEAVQECERTGRGGKGTIVVWAVFNEKRNIDPNSLEAHPLVVCVAPSDQDDVRSPNSGFGGGLDLLAPGVAVTGLAGTSNKNARLSVASGASFAAPCVAGVAALALSIHPDYTASELRALLQKSADPEDPNKQWNEEAGWGRLNARIAMEAAVKTAKAKPPPPPNA